ncbi:MAG: PKD domain-containing protein, partial [Thomasclavelia ramosa]
MISSKDIKDGKIKVKNLIITCDEIDTSKKGQYAVKFYTNDVDQKEINKSVKISDISKPEIKCDKKINITVSQIAAFNILEFINVTDNDDQEPTVKLELDKQMNGPGNYTVIVTAQDTSGNSSTKKVKIKVDADPEIPKENSDNFADKQKKTDIQENSDVSKKNPNENTSKVDK